MVSVEEGYGSVVTDVGTVLLLVQEGDVSFIKEGVNVAQGVSGVEQGKEVRGKEVSVVAVDLGWDAIGAAGLAKGKGVKHGCDLLCAEGTVGMGRCCWGDLV
jgi:hypothetical protein